MEYGCALAGLVLVSANPSFHSNELRYVLEQSDSVGLFMVTSHRGNPMGTVADAAVSGLGAVREVVDVQSTDEMFAAGGRTPTLPVVAPTDAAQIQYTSGTTGFPKGAVLSHRA